MQTAEPLVLLRVPMDGRAASFRLQSGPEAGISWIKFAVIVIVRLDWATSASSPATSASFTKGHFKMRPWIAVPALQSDSHALWGQIRRTQFNVTKPTFLRISRSRNEGARAAGKPSRGGALPSLWTLCNVQPLVEPLLALELHRC